MSRHGLATALLGIALVLSSGARAGAIEAVTISGDGVLTICRNWILFRSCKPYDKMGLPRQISVGDKIDFTFGSNPKDYIFHVMEIRQKGDGCVILSDVSGGMEDRERLEIPRCQPIAKPVTGSR